MWRLVSYCEGFAMFMYVPQYVFSTTPTIFGTRSEELDPAASAHQPPGQKDHAWARYHFDTVNHD